MLNVWPAICPTWSEARKAINHPISRGSPALRRGTALSIALTIFSPTSAERVACPRLEFGAVLDRPCSPSRKPGKFAGEGFGESAQAPRAAALIVTPAFPTFGGTRAQRNDPAYLLHPRGSGPKRKARTSTAFYEHIRDLAADIAACNGRSSPPLHPDRSREVSRPSILLMSRHFTTRELGQRYRGCPPTRRPLLVPQRPRFVRLSAANQHGRARRICRASEESTQIGLLLLGEHGEDFGHRKLYVYHWPPR